MSPSDHTRGKAPMKEQGSSSRQPSRRRQRLDYTQADYEAESHYFRDPDNASDWRWLRPMVASLIGEFGVPTDEGRLPDLPFRHPQINAAMMAVIDELRGEVRSLRTEGRRTQTETQGTRDDLEVTTTAHNNLAHGVIKLEDRVDTLEARPNSANLANMLQTALARIAVLEDLVGDLTGQVATLQGQAAPAAEPVEEEPLEENGDNAEEEEVEEPEVIDP